MGASLQWRAMSAPQETLSALFQVLAQHTAGLTGGVGAEEARQRLQLVQQLVARLPHRFLLAATREEIQAAGGAMMAEGRTRDDMRVVQASLVALLDHAHSAGALPWHPLRNLGDARARPTSAPEAALVVGLPPVQAEVVRKLLVPFSIVAHAEPVHAAALESTRWFPFSFVLTTVPPYAPITFLESVRAPASLCRGTRLVMLARAEQERDAQNFIGRGANRVVALGEIAEKLPAVVAELRRVSERHRVCLTVEADLVEGWRSASWKTENISASGMLLRTDEPVPVGGEVDLVFTVPGDDLPIHARARVVRSTTFGRESFAGVGVTFSSFVGEGQHRYELYLSRLRGQ